MCIRDSSNILFQIKADPSAGRLHRAADLLSIGIFYLHFDFIRQFFQICLRRDKDGNDTLTVNVLFTDPQAGASLTQAQTYPYIAAETNLEELPDKIEMKIKYAD